MALDKATQGLLHKVKSLNRLVSLDEWQVFRAEIFNLLAETVDLRKLSTSDAKKVQFEVAVRQEVFRLLNSWILEAEVNAKIQLEEPKERDYVHREG